ncbi:MAG: PASTA domain-containing protein [Anaeromyxobacter sp.]|nr:PASTA domain-containing protein [Anaeromyxobacter sp.]
MRRLEPSRCSSRTGRLLPLLAAALLGAACGGSGGGAPVTPPTVTVPSLVGLSQAAATTALTAAGLSVGEVGLASSPTAPAGQVVGQDPAAGATVATGAAVDLVVSSGPSTVTVPSLAGLTQAEAQAALDAAGLNLGAVTTSASPTVPAGQIISQVPSAGEVVLPLSGVALVISSGPGQGPVLPPDPSTVAPPVPAGVATTLAASTAFLYEGPDPIQTGVAPGTIRPERAAVLRGALWTRAGAPLSGARVRVVGHPELGETLSRADGRYDLAVNGGGTMTVSMEAEGYLPSQRQVVAPWAGFVSVPDVVLIPLDPAVTTVASGAIALQVARGTASSDDSGTRRSTVLFPAGTSASLLMPDGTTVPAPVLHFRSTEYTVGASGPEAMPGTLPASSAYTYAVELSADEGLAGGASHVVFSTPVVHYVENFLGFPAGTAVPYGWYDRDAGLWRAGENGVVLTVLGATGGAADVALDAGGAPADAAALAAIGIDVEERQALASLYAPGQSLWRVRMSHFSPADLNWGIALPLDARPPPAPPGRDPLVPDPFEECGSVIGCEGQSLGESLPVAGTPWRLHHQSERMPGFRAESHLDLPLTGASIPPSLRRVELRIQVAGRDFAWGYPAAAGLSQPFDFDGKDAYGRDVWGTLPVRVRLGYTYAAVYSSSRGFGYPGSSGLALAGSPTRLEITIWREYQTSVRRWNAGGLGLAGWSLSVHHTYDPSSRLLLYGDGRTRQIPTAVIQTVIPTALDSGTKPHNGSVAVDQDGSLWIGISFPSPGGIIHSTPTGTTIGTLIPRASKQVVGPDGWLYAITNSDGQVTIRRFPPGHTGGSFGSTLLAGPPDTGPAVGVGDGIPAIGAIIQPDAMAVGQDGSVYFTETTGVRIRRIGTDGILSTFAGDGSFPDATGDGGPATAAGLGIIGNIAAAPDGSLYLEDRWNARVRRIGPDGIIQTVAGNGTAPTVAGQGDGGPATEAAVDPVGIAISPDGLLTILQAIIPAISQPASVRQVAADGTISTIAGGGFAGDGPAIGANMSFAGVTPKVTWGPDGLLYLGGGNAQGTAIMRILPALPAGGQGELQIPDEDGQEVHVFTSEGRHLRTVEGTTGGLIRAFTYDASGRLTSMTDGAGNVTAVERSGSTPTALVGPYGHRTLLGVDGAGWLARVEDPTGGVRTAISSAAGLLQSFEEPGGRSHSYTYDSLGRLTEDRGPGGAVTTLARSGTQGDRTVTTTSALGRNRRYRVTELPQGGFVRTVVDASGATRSWTTNAAGGVVATAEDGTVTTVEWGPDPRWGLVAPVAASIMVETPSGNTRTITATRTASLALRSNPFSVTALEETVTEAGQTWRAAYAAATRTWTLTSPTGRAGSLQLDAEGRATTLSPAGLTPVTFGYDARGRVSGRAEGTRTRAFTYGADGRLSSLTDAPGRTFGFARDALGQVTGESLPGGRLLGLGWDAASHLATVTPPGRSAHTLAWAPTDWLASVTPPAVSGAGTLSTLVTRDADRRLARLDLPDGDAVVQTYAAASGGLPGTAGQLVASTMGAGTAAFTWDAAGRLSTAAAGGVTFTAGWDGALLTAQAWSGAVAGAVTSTHDARHRPASTSVGGVTAALTYDADGLLVGAGALAIGRAAASGLPTSTTLGTVTTSEGHDAFGAPATFAASAGGSPLYAAAWSRDALGRITGVVETVQGTTRAIDYGYDAAGRLATVTVDGALASTSGYDPQGNRTSHASGGPAVSATFDAQDRLLAAGSTTYAWTPTGTLASRTGGAGTTSYQHDALGRLRGVLLPDGRQLDYLLDGLGRRIGKRVNGAVAEAYLFDGERPVAWLDGAGAVKAVFVYRPGHHAPDYLVSGAGTFRILSDQLGSPRLVVDAASGAVAQRLDYDALGQVLLDSNPGFQPFGFAGGLRDLDTGLVHFGARDYDPATGRWTSKDPIGFAAGDTNLYAYAGNDPVNRIDPSGLEDVCAGRRRVRPGDTLFVSSHETDFYDSSRLSPNGFRRHLNLNEPVTFRGMDPSDSRFVMVEQGGQAGVILKENLSTKQYGVETQPSHRDFGPPMDTKAYESHGAGTKG